MAGSLFRLLLGLLLVLLTLGREDVGHALLLLEQAEGVDEILSKPETEKEEAEAK